jgi:hypothetical protein
MMMCRLSKSQDKHGLYQAVLKGVGRVGASLRFSQDGIMMMCLSK